MDIRLTHEIRADWMAVGANDDEDDDEKDHGCEPSRAVRKGSRRLSRELGAIKKLPFVSWSQRATFPRFLKTTFDLCGGLSKWSRRPVRGGFKSFAPAAIFVLRAHAARNLNSQVEFEAGFRGIQTLNTREELIIEATLRHQTHLNSGNSRMNLDEYWRSS